ncbi:DUF1097 domain-containing protein [Pendulispora rubella]|uniref:DUF1097 domain-containing protein n=1 Tax=Pendulispora rubella TaxID=2741070 RepID=A0ABZ2L211_9BACT
MERIMAAGVSHARESTSAQWKITVGESLVASGAATVSFVLLDLPVWAMFIGWIAYFTRGIDFRHGAINFACVLVGLACGMAAALGLHALGPHLGAWTITVVVFSVAMVVVSLRLVPVFNNLLGFFLGLVSYFASHLPPSGMTFVKLGVAAAVGSIAGWLASLVQKHWSAKVRATPAV